MNLNPREIADYCLAHSTPPSAELKALERETNLKTLAPQMISGPLQGQFLRMLSLLIQPRNVLEIGTFTGYSTLCLAEGLHPEGRLYTLEANEELSYISRKYFQRSGKAEQIRHQVGDAKALIADLDGPFDLVLIDAGKFDYATYFDLTVDKVCPGGLLLADNVLWSGKVVLEAHDKDTQLLDAFNKKVHADPRVETLLLPLRDGLMLMRRL